MPKGDGRKTGIFRKEEMAEADQGCPECAKRIANAMEEAGHFRNAALNTLVMALGIWLAHNVKREGFHTALPLIEEMLRRQYAKMRPQVEAALAEPAGNA